MSTATIVEFLKSIGLPVILDQSRLLCPGELLLEAGHLAVLPPTERSKVNGHAENNGDSEVGSTAWAWAAAHHLGLDPSVVFHDTPCQGDGQPGVPALQRWGLTTATEYPAMHSWLRDELGVLHLRRLWTCHQDLNWVTANTLISGLGLGLRETFDYLLQEKTSFEDFEAWILARNGGAIEPERIMRLNVALSDAGVAGVPVDPDAEPVLSPDDLAFWDENGYVILHDAVSPENCQAAVQAICQYLGVDLNRPDTWYLGPQGHSIWIPLMHHAAIWANRRSARIHRAFAQLWGRDDLWGTVDQAGFNPPERPGWQFPGPHLHWDVSLKRPIPFGVQGILYLTDTAANQGAFVCVPGFHRKIDEWLENLSEGADPRKHDFSASAIPIAGRAGDLVIWHHALPHGSSPNHATVPRLVQYIFKRPSHWGYHPEWI